MNKMSKIAVLGGDKRLIFAVRELVARGHFVYTWGLPEDSLPTEVEAKKDWREALAIADTIILPLPLSRDGVCVSVPLVAGVHLPFEELLPCLIGKRVLGGCICDSVRLFCNQNKIPCIDYFESEIFQLKNALPTAEGAIDIAMQHLPVVLDGISAVVIGYGRIGELLARKLCALGVNVTVMARRREVLTRAELAGCKGISLSGDSKRDFSRLTDNVRVIFNTVPSQILDQNALNCLPQSCLLIELASTPGGIDMQAAEKRGMHTVFGNALPGKYAPESAGIILAQTVEAIQDEYF